MIEPMVIWHRFVFICGLFSVFDFLFHSCFFFVSLFACSEICQIMWHNKNCSQSNKAKNAIHFIFLCAAHPSAVPPSTACNLTTCIFRSWMCVTWLDATRPSLSSAASAMCRVNGIWPTRGKTKNFLFLFVFLWFFSVFGLWKPNPNNHTWNVKWKQILSEGKAFTYIHIYISRSL